VTVPANSQAVLEFDPAQEKSMKLWGAELSASPRLTHTTGRHGADAWTVAAGSYVFEGEVR
jgi:hypothetical protein